MNKCKILIVEDEFINQQAISYIIQKYSYKYEIVKVTSNGEEAINCLKHNVVNVVITDIKMPRVDGIELTKYIMLNYQHIEVIILSSYDDFDYVKDAFKSGAFEYILKPQLTEEKLTIAIDKACNINSLVLPKKESLHQNIFKDYFRYKDYLEEFVLSEEYKCDLLLLAFNLETNKVTNQTTLKEIIINKVIEYANNSIVKYYFTKDKILLISIVDDSEFYEIEKLSLVISDILFDTVFNYSMHKVGDDTIEIIANLIASAKMSFFVDNNTNHYCSRQFELKPLTLYSDTKAIINNLDNVISYLNEFLMSLVNNFVYKESEIKQHLEHILYYTFSKHFNNKIIDDSNYYNPIKMMNMIARCKNISHLIDLVNVIFYDISENVKDNNANSFLLYKIENYISENYDKHISLSDLSEEFNISYSHLSVYFTKYAGVGFSDYLNEYRINVAADLLVTTDISIADVCQQVGIYDQSYFSKVFKKYKTLSPSNYRKQNYEKQ